MWKLDEIWQSLQFARKLSSQNVTQSEPSFKVNHAGNAAVSRNTYWEPMETAPKGVKLQLHTIHGTAVYGELNLRNINDFNAWAPCPKET